MIRTAAGSDLLKARPSLEASQPAKIFVDFSKAATNPIEEFKNMNELYESSKT